MAFDYPILLDLSGRTVVIVGGGAVAVRKARGLLAAGALRVRVVAQEFHPDLPTDGVERVSSPYDQRHLHDASLVFAATDVAEVNAQVVVDAQRRGILVSRADQRIDDVCPDGADFIVPAVHREGAMMIAVSAGSAALSAAIRDDVRRQLDPRWARMADIMRTLRPRIRDRNSLSPQRRHAVFHDLATPAALDAADDGAESLWAWLVQRHPDLAQSPADNKT